MPIFLKHIMKCENEYSNEVHITRRISSQDFFAGLDVIADVMLESSASDEGLTADAILSLCYPPAYNLHITNNYKAFSTLQGKLKSAVTMRHEVVFYPTIQACPDGTVVLKGTLTLKNIPFKMNIYVK